MKKVLFFNSVLILLFSTSMVKAQDSAKNLPEVHYKYGIGGGAGFATGYGLSFRYIPKKIGGQINFAPFKNKETERYSVGLTLIYILIESKITNLFLYQANHYYYNSQMIYIYDPNLPDSQGKVRNTESYFNNGLGFGIEIIMAKRVGLNLMAGYAFYNNFTQLNVTGEAALYYKF
ncbi:MAG: hypothetical protein V4511_08275 [Bacteroidota bacterium]